MGTFGIGIFENDAALDWLGSFNSRKTLKALEKTLNTYEQSKDKIGAEEVLACCEVIAAIMGYPSDELDPEIEEWSDKQRKKLDEKLIHRAIVAVESISTKSELNELWKESNEHKDWLAVQVKLIARLRNKPLIPGEEKSRRPPILRIRGPKCSMEAKQYRFGESLPKLTEDTSGVGVATDVILSLSQDISEDEIKQVANWISNYPNVYLWITDYPKRKTFPVNIAFLNYFSWLEKLVLSLSSVKSFSFINSFCNLEKLTINMSKANNLFEALAKLPKLKELKLYECDLQKLATDLPNLSKLNNLISFELVFIRSGLMSEEGQPIQCKIILNSLPDLPQYIERLTISCVEIRDIKSLENAAALKKIDIVGLRSNTKFIDLSKLSTLQRLEIVGASGIERIIIPPNVVSLQLQNTYGLQAYLPESVEKLIALRIDADTIYDSVDSGSVWTHLQYLALSGKQSFRLASKFKNAPVLKCLTIDRAESCNYSFKQFPKLKFISVSNFEGDSTFIASLSSLNELLEIDISYKLECTKKLSIKDFAPLKELSKLERLNIIGVGFNESEKDEVAQLLGIQVNNWKRRTKRERFLTNLEKELSLRTNDD